MSFFSLLESFFFVSLGLSFLLILLMVYHFKKKTDTLEKRIETLTDITKTLVTNYDNRSIHASESNTSFIDMPKNDMNLPNQSSQFLPQDWNPVYKNIVVSESILDKPGILQYQVDGNAELDDVHSFTSSSSTQESIQEQDAEDLESVDLDVIGNDSIQSSSTHTSSIEQLLSPTVLLDRDPTEPNETIQVTKLETTTTGLIIVDESDLLESVTLEDEPDEIETVAESVLTEDPDTEKNTTKDTSVLPHTKKSLQKMNVQMLKTMAIRDGLCNEPGKMKKGELVQLILNNQLSTSS